MKRKKQLKINSGIWKSSQQRRGFVKHVLEKCNYACVGCGAVDGLTVHHFTRQYGYRDPRSAEILCVDCHAKQHGGEKPTAIISEPWKYKL